MARFSVLLALVAATVAVSANPIVIRDSLITLPIARRFNGTGHMVNLLKLDQARAKVLKARSQATAMSDPSSSSKLLATFNVPATHHAVIYTANVGIGFPPTTYQLIVDTGSSNTWVGAGRPYVKTSTSVDTRQRVAMGYGSGSFSGEEYIDTVTIGGLVIEKQSIGVASTSTGFDDVDVDGILGIGPTDLTVDTVVGATSTSNGFEGVDSIRGIVPTDLTQGTTSSGAQVPTVVDNAFAQRLISAKVIGISFEPTTAPSVTNGELTFGGVDNSKFMGDIAYVPITSTSPASAYVGIDQSITYGTSGTSILSSTAGITDTGTTLILLASDAFGRYKQATGAVMDVATGLLRITPAQYANLKSLSFHIGSNTYDLTPNAQIWPRSLNTLIGGYPNAIYLIVGDLGSPSGQGLDFINGYAFLERFYHVYDSANRQVGFAMTQFTHATTN